MYIVSPICGCILSQHDAGEDAGEVSSLPSKSKVRRHQTLPKISEMVSAVLDQGPIVLLTAGLFPTARSTWEPMGVLFANDTCSVGTWRGS